MLPRTQHRATVNRGLTPGTAPVRSGHGVADQQQVLELPTEVFGTGKNYQDFINPSHWPGWKIVVGWQFGIVVRCWEKKSRSMRQPREAPLPALPRTSYQIKYQIYFTLEVFKFLFFGVFRGFFFFVKSREGVDPPKP